MKYVIVDYPHLCELNPDMSVTHQDWCTGDCAAVVWEHPIPGFPDVDGFGAMVIWPTEDFYTDILPC
jgi:hypothetical protein